MAAATAAIASAKEDDAAAPAGVDADADDCAERPAGAELARPGTAAGEGPKSSTTGSWNYRLRFSVSTSSSSATVMPFELAW